MWYPIVDTVATRPSSCSLKSRDSYGNSTLFLQRSQYISLYFCVLKKKMASAALNPEQFLSVQLWYLHCNEQLHTYAIPGSRHH